MIVALADDFSGAAELAGISLNLGVQAEVQTWINLDVNSEVVIIDTDTRSIPFSRVEKQFTKLLTSLKKFPPEWIYKKTDSVLRGHVLKELELLLVGLNLEKCLIIPANPSLGRVIVNGKYYIDGIPLHKTIFASDPEYPAGSSEVENLLGKAEKFKVKFFTRPQNPFYRGITVGEVTSLDEIQQWMGYTSHDCLPGGGSDFFRVFLPAKQNLKISPRSVLPYLPGEQRLIVSGSLSGMHKNMWQEEHTARLPVCQFPGPISADSDLHETYMKKWIRNISIVLKSHSQVLAIVGQPVADRAMVVEMLSDMVERIFQICPIDELIIEGGSTASRILRVLNWHRLKPIHELSRGVVALENAEGQGPRMIVKPGSYHWPPTIWQQN